MTSQITWMPWSLSLILSLKKIGESRNISTLGVSDRVKVRDEGGEGRQNTTQSTPSPPPLNHPNSSTFLEYSVTENACDVC